MQRTGAAGNEILKQKKRKLSRAGVDLKTCQRFLGGEQTGRSSDVSGPLILQQIVSFNPEFNIWE